MSYLKDFQTHIGNHDYPAFLRLWEEYCAADEVDAEELIQILKHVKGTTIAEPFGRHVDRILPLWRKLDSTPMAHEVIKLILDLQTTNNEMFATLAYDYLKGRYSDQKYFNDKIRLIGLRSKENFQGAISNYELLSHLDKGKYVFHTGGWGVGEVIDVSLIREQLSVEFDYVPGKKDLSFANAFKTLIPIPDDHFLALRFGNPDFLEEKAKENSAEVVRMLLRDLGPKTAAEIKDELCELVIPAKDWTRWWQNARAKVKKDTMIETPEDARDQFRLRHAEVSHEERLEKALEHKPDANTLIQMVYSFMKDFPETLKNEEFKATLTAKLSEMLNFQEITDAQELQLHFFLEDLNGGKNHSPVAELIKQLNPIEDIVNVTEILAFKKRVLVEARRLREDWEKIFLNMLFTVDQAPLRDYLLNEIISSGKAQDELKKKLEELAAAPQTSPDACLWYFQKVMHASNLPFSDKKGKIKFFEAFLILLSRMEHIPEQRDMVKKMHALLSAGRYAIVREIMQGAKIDDVKEFLLLATKCHSLSDHDIKILHSLAEVVHPSLNKTRKKEATQSDNQLIWTTQKGYQALQARIEQIATVETIDNAREIEIARSHGDLRENAEFKAALEKRDRLQSELKLLSSQLNASRVLTREDISTHEVGVGTVVECKDAQGKKVTYTLLGPWDADPDKNVLAFQSKLAQTMKGLKVGDTFQFQGQEMTITAIRSYLK